MSTVDIAAVKAYLQGLQESICSTLANLDGQAEFAHDQWQRENPKDGGGNTRTLTDGAVFEKAGVAFSHIRGTKMPPSATANRPELAGRHWEALGVSLVIHPNNPFVPTSHANVRFFIAHKEGEDPIWWFGGGYDLTPYYGFEEDCIHWHKTAKSACEPFGVEIYPELKKWCDEYFYMPHRGEPRGVGGLFYDDFNRFDFNTSFQFMQSVGDSFLAAYLPIVQKRKDLPFNEQQKDWQLHRRGRYVEFNLVFDRGTHFGLQSGGRTESILMSLPANVRWSYQYTPEPNSEESKLLSDYLCAKDWLGANL